MFITDGVEDVEVALHLLIDVEDGGDVSTSVAVVGCRPNGDEVLVFEPVSEAVHDQLMGSSDEFEIVDVVKLGGDAGAEKPSGTSWGKSPSFNLFWVGPHQVAEGTLVRNLHASFEQADLVESFDVG